MQDRHIGEVRVTRIEEQMGPGFPAKDFFPEFDAETFAAEQHWLAPSYYIPESGRLLASIHSWLVRTGKYTVLIDACSGNHKPRPGMPRFDMLNTQYLDRLREAGVQPEEIDFVMCTHLHVDHVGWNTKLENGRWVPTFKNARYLFAKREYAHWENEHKTKGLETNGGSFDDSVLPVVEAGKAVMIDSDHQPDPLLTIKDYPGHTPGSIAINLKDGGSQATFSGDIMHHPIQVYHPDWSSQFCSDQELSAKSRRKLLEDCSESGALLCPAHFPGANAGYITPQGNAFRINWDVVK